MMKRISYILGLFLVAVVLSGCQEEGSRQAPPLTKKHRTVIEYMVADNNLYNYAVGDVNEMEAVWDEEINGHMVVYLYPVAKSSRYAPQVAGYDETPRLLLISRDQTDKIASRVLKTYSRDEDPTDPVVMGRVIGDAMALAPAENYGLVLWSHGSGWVPKGLGQSLKSVWPTVDLSEEGSAVSKLTGVGIASEAAGAQRAGNAAVGYSFGQSESHGNAEMEVDALARALPAGVVFDFILFDACHMACVEVAWELRKNTDYLIASAAETLANGFPYLTIMEPMFAAGEADVVRMASEFYDYYEAQSGAYQSATVSVVRSAALPALAASMKTLCDGGVPEAGTGLYFGAQQYGRVKIYFDDTFYDLGDFVQHTWAKGEPAKLAAFGTALTGAVVYKAATPRLFSTIRVVNHTGLSCYLPRLSTPKSLEAYRSRFGWSGASGMGTLVP